MNWKLQNFFDEHSVLVKLRGLELFFFKQLCVLYTKKHEIFWKWQFSVFCVLMSHRFTKKKRNRTLERWHLKF